MSINKKTTIISAVLVSSVLLSGCGLLGDKKKEEIDPPQSVSITDEGEATVKETSGEEAEAAETLATELYLIDKNGYVVPQTIQLPKTNSVAKQALEYLVVNGLGQDLLPNDFRAVIPAETKLSVNVEDKVATVDFSNEFKEYQPEDEMKIVQSITWTLTQFDSIDKVKLKLNGHELTEMPVNKTPLTAALSRANGINIDTTNTIDITHTKPVTVYYLGGSPDSYYYVPVTKRVSNEETDNIAAVVNELAEGPHKTSNLENQLSRDVKLLTEPVVADGKVTLNFNEEIYSSFEEKIISQHVMNSIVLSLTEQNGIESVVITVNGDGEFVNEEGDAMTEPVTRPEKVNTSSF